MYLASRCISTDKTFLARESRLGCVCRGLWVVLSVTFTLLLSDVMPLFFGIGFFWWTCCWCTWSCLVTRPVTCLLLFCLCFEVLALGNIYFLILGLFCGTGLPPWVGVLKNICISFIPHTTTKRFIYPPPSDGAALLLLHHIGCGPRLKAGLLREFAASLRQHLEE